MEETSQPQQSQNNKRKSKLPIYIVIIFIALILSLVVTIATTYISRVDPKESNTECIAHYLRGWPFALLEEANIYNHPLDKCDSVRVGEIVPGEERGKYFVSGFILDCLIYWIILSPLVYFFIFSRLNKPKIINQEEIEKKKRIKKIIIISLIISLFVSAATFFIERQRNYTDTNCFVEKNNGWPLAYKSEKVYIGQNNKSCGGYEWVIKLGDYGLPETYISLFIVDWLIYAAIISLITGLIFKKNKESASRLSD